MEFIGGKLMEILLMSYLAGTKAIVEKYLSKMTDKKITFIPTAGNVEEYTGFIDEGVGMLKELGYEIEIVDIAKYEEEVLKDKFLKAECICISGDNTFYLLQELKRKNLTELLSGRIKEGMFYMGESAGAMIMSKDIVYSQIMDDKNVATELKDYFGLNVFKYYTLPHIGEYPFKETAQETLDFYKDKIDLIPINNREAVLVKDNGYKILKEMENE